MLARRLNEFGTSEFRRYIDETRNGGTAEPPISILEDHQTSEPLECSIELDRRSFRSRFDMGVYITSKIEDGVYQQFLGDAGFWNWLALYWFDDLCPLTSNLRKPSMYYNYILSSDYRHRPRHALHMSWRLVRNYGKKAQFLLSKPMSVRGEIIEQMMARQDILSFHGVMTLASELYTDEKTGKYKKGAAARKSAGCVSRYIVWLQQLDLTYDLYSIVSSDLRSLLPAEFARFQ